uniref:Uncharacterized protein n=1 Tax=Rhizophora mucronata TaxID=61149 RepID=A0A2P2Q8M7_RHIMU
MLINCKPENHGVYTATPCRETKKALSLEGSQK